MLKKLASLVAHMLAHRGVTSDGSSTSSKGGGGGGGEAFEA